MASGLLGAENISANNETILYTVPDATFAVVTVSITNRSSANTTTVRLGLLRADETTGGDHNWCEYETTITPNGTLERTGIVLDAAQKITLISSQPDVSAQVYGIETLTL